MGASEREFVGHPPRTDLDRAGDQVFDRFRQIHQTKVVPKRAGGLLVVIVGLAVTRFWLLTALLGVAYLLVICWSVWRHLRGMRP